MPKIDFAKMNSLLMQLDPQYDVYEFKGITRYLFKKDGTVRATKPKVDKNNPITGKAAYVWRMLVFAVSPKPQHQCMPCTADFDLPAYDENGKWSSKIARSMSKDLQPLEDLLLECIDKRQWFGVQRWARAFGVIN